MSAYLVDGFIRDRDGGVLWNGQWTVRARTTKSANSTALRQLRQRRAKKYPDAHEYEVRLRKTDGAGLGALADFVR